MAMFIYTALYIFKGKNKDKFINQQTNFEADKLYKSVITYITNRKVDQIVDQ